MEQTESLNVDIGSPKVGRKELTLWNTPVTTSSILTEDNFNERGYVKDQAWSGTQVTNDAAGGVLAVEIPWYSNIRFNYTYVGNVISKALGYEFDAIAINKGITDDSLFVSWDHYVSVGEDYNVFFFLGVPALWNVP